VPIINQIEKKSILKRVEKEKNKGRVPEKIFGDPVHPSPSLPGFSSACHIYLNLSFFFPCTNLFYERNLRTTSLVCRVAQSHEKLED